MSTAGPIRSTCPYCGVGCGVLLAPDGAGGLAVTGDPDHPVNRGLLCSKGTALGETVNMPERLTTPLVHGRPVSWDTALGLVADRFRRILAAHGPDSIAFYVSGQLLTEDYYVANKLMKGFIGSANIDTNSRLCMASAVAGHRRAFGTDTVPGTYEDIDEADLVVLVGSNLAWCHPILHRRLLAARKRRGTRIVVIDPRRTATAEEADLHLAIAPGMDAALFNRLLVEIAASGAADRAFLAHVEGFEAALASARAESAGTGLSEEEIARFCRLWIGTERVVTVFSQGINQSTSGTDKVNAIINCHLATGRIGRPGMGPFSVTGQPNAMGGREVGGLANMLACHMELENPAHREAVRAFWQAPRIPEKPGLKAVEMFEAVSRGEIRAIWIIHTNPAVTLPRADAVRNALKACDFVVVSDITRHTDTAACADVLLPALAWGEKDGTVTNSDRTISRQRPALPGPRGARADWAILAEVGRRMGWPEAFAYASPAEIFREHTSLSGVAGAFGLDFDISALAGLSDEEYDALTPVRWPVTAARRGGRFFADGRFFHPDGRARMVPVRAAPPAGRPSPERPFLLNTGRTRDHWHTMTRSGLSPRLSAHMAEPWLDIHPADAAAHELESGDLAEVASDHGHAVLRVRVTEAQRPGQLFAPMHWSGQNAPTGRISALVPGRTDPVSGQPEAKATPVSLRRFPARWHAFAAATRRFRPVGDYWALARAREGWRAEMAGCAAITDWEELARRLFALPSADLAMVADPARGTCRLALREGGQLAAVLFVAPEPVALMREHVVSCLGTEAPHVLSGRPPADMPDPGPTLCACLGLGVNTIARAVAAGGLSRLEEVMEATGAGTGCGSCRAEIAALLARMSPQEAAE